VTTDTKISREHVAANCGVSSPGQGNVVTDTPSVDPGEALAPTSLVPSHQTVPTEVGRDECRNGPQDMRLWCHETGEVRLVPCRRLGCTPCLQSAVWRRGLAIADSAPERFLTFTLVGEDWQTVRGRMKRLRYEIVQELGRCDWVWSVEPNPARTGHHVHGWQRGDFLLQARLSEMATRRGMGMRVDIQRWHERGGEGYALKGVGYGMKGSEADVAAETFLRVNGGRLTHASRGFFRDGVRAAEARGVARARANGEAQTWELVTVSDLHRSLAARAPRA
jgi:hypothetical protein